MSLFNSKVGYEYTGLFNTHTSIGFEISNREDLNGDEDLANGKIYLRRELIGLTSMR